VNHYFVIKKTTHYTSISSQTFTEMLHFSDCFCQRRSVLRNLSNVNRALKHRCAIETTYPHSPGCALQRKTLLAAVPNWTESVDIYRSWRH